MDGKCGEEWEMEDMFLCSHKGDVPSCMSVFEGCRDKHTYILRVLFSHGFHVNAPMLQSFSQVTPQKGLGWGKNKLNVFFSTYFLVDGNMPVNENTPVLHRSKFNRFSCEVVNPEINPENCVKSILCVTVACKSKDVWGELVDLIW